MQNVLAIQCLSFTINVFKKKLFKQSIFKIGLKGSTVKAESFFWTQENCRRRKWWSSKMTNAPDPYKKLLHVLIVEYPFQPFCPWSAFSPRSPNTCTLIVTDFGQLMTKCRFAALILHIDSSNTFKLIMLEILKVIKREIQQSFFVF